jgi:hypothetical protein
MNADQQQVVAEMLVQNLQHMNESGTADDVVQALNLINLFMGVEMDEEYKEMDDDEEKENQVELLPPLVDSDDDDIPALVNAVEYDSEYDDMPELVDDANDENNSIG